MAKIKNGIEQRLVLLFEELDYKKEVSLTVKGKPPATMKLFSRAKECFLLGSSENWICLLRRINKGVNPNPLRFDVTQVAPVYAFPKWPGRFLLLTATETEDDLSKIESYIRKIRK